MSDTRQRYAMLEHMVRELVDRAARNHTVFVECSPELLAEDVFSQPLHVMLQTAENGTHTLVFKESDEIVRLRDENAALRAAVERVRALHTPVHSVFTGHMVCDVCRALLQPCPTLRALEGTP